MINRILIAGLLLTVFACGTSKKAMQYTGPTLSQTKEEGRLKVMLGDVEVLGHQYEVKKVPPGVHQHYEKSGFIHPLKTPSGKLLTQIQPADHYHHYGIWNPWTHVAYEGDTIDFWNLAKEQATVLWNAFDNEKATANKVSYTAEHHHYRLKGELELALREDQNITVKTLSPTSYTVDFDLDYKCGTDSPFTILEYRYAGFGWRCTEEWNKENSMVLTSKNHPRQGSDGTRATWILVQGELGDDYGGVLMMTYPTNYNHVAGEGEPIRVWPENNNQLFANFSPTKNMDWVLDPGKNYNLKYRMLVFDGKFDAAMANAAYADYVK